MSKTNPLAGLIGYGESDEESDDGGANTLPAQNTTNVQSNGVYVNASQQSSASIHLPPISHCPWSACYDETSGFTYYWNQQTNAVTWEAPPEYLLALKLAQQQLTSGGSTEVSVEEWQLYQQALADKANPKMKAKLPTTKPVKKETNTVTLGKNGKPKKRKSTGSDTEEKIELITSYSNSDSESETETPIPTKSVPPKIPSPKPVTPAAKPAKVSKVPVKKKPKLDPVEYGPSLPPNQSYTVPIGPELPPEMIQENKVIPKDEEIKTVNEEDQDESVLLMKLKDKAKILENLGGELPKDVKKIIKQNSRGSSPAQTIDETSRASSIDTNIDDLLEEIEKKELPKAKKQKIDILTTETDNPKSGNQTPTEPEFKPLFPSSLSTEEPIKTLFPSASNVQNGEESENNRGTPPLVVEKKGANLYILDGSEAIENTSKRKLRISNSVLPDRPKSEVPSYTTKYSQHIEGFSSERTGLGFSNNENEETSTKGAIKYGNGLMFTKGETLNEDKKDDDWDDLAELVELKLKHLNELQPSPVTPVQEMYIQMQTLLWAHRRGGLTAGYFRSWVHSAHEQIRARELKAPPIGWTATFCRSEARYRYRRDADGLEQWEFPAEGSTDMEICNTPPHPSVEESPPPAACSPPRPPPPPPPAWTDPPPPGTDPAHKTEPPKPQLDELASFYSEIAEFEKQSKPPTPDPPLPPEPPRISDPPITPQEPIREKSLDREVIKDGKVKKKTKVKISSSMGMKHKTVSTLVAKWQQVADEIHSD